MPVILIKDLNKKTTPINALNPEKQRDSLADSLAFAKGMINRNLHTKSKHDFYVHITSAAVWNELAMFENKKNVTVEIIE